MKKSCLNNPINGRSNSKRQSSVDKSNDKILSKPVVPFVTIRDSKTSERDENNSNESEDDLYSDGYYQFRGANEYYRTPISPNANSISKSLKEPQRISLAMAICTENLVGFRARHFVILNILEDSSDEQSILVSIHCIEIKDPTCFEFIWINRLLSEFNLVINFVEQS